MVLNFLLMVQAEAPYQAVDFKEYMLPLAEKLVELSDGKVPSWQALLGYVAWRAGDLDKSEAAFAESVRLYDEWRSEDKIQPADCEGLLRAQLFLSTVLHAEGEKEAAFAEVDAVTRFCAPITREYSGGALTSKWIGGLLPLKMALEEDNFSLAKERLPRIGKVKQDNLMPFDAIVTAYKLYIDTRIVASQGKYEAAKRGHAKMAALLTEIKDKQKLVSMSPEFGDYVRELQTLGILHKALTGDVTEQKGMINVWYQAAADAQIPSSRLLPPNILYPMEYKLGVIQEKAGRKSDAKESFETALKRQPSYRKAVEALTAVQSE
jgi:tetratricopeptide (TPR) repeat protein